MVSSIPCKTVIGRMGSLFPETGFQVQPLCLFRRRKAIRSIKAWDLLPSQIRSAEVAVDDSLLHLDAVKALGIRRGGIGGGHDRVRGW